MNYNKLSPMPERKTRFLKMFDHTRIVPDKSGCYVLTDYAGNIVYIGQSNNLHKRLTEHLDDSDKNAYYFFWLLQSESKIAELEIKWFKLYKIKNAGRIPRLNKQDPSN